MGKSFDFLLTAAALIAGILLLTGHGDFLLKGGNAELRKAKYDEAKTVDKSIEIPIQINGKLRSVITVDAESPKESILETARADERVSSAIDGKTVVKEIYVPGKLVNIVVK